MKWTILNIGIPTHFKPDQNKNITACGIVGGVLSTINKKEVNCLRCIKTKVFRRKI